MKSILLIFFAGLFLTSTTNGQTTNKSDNSPRFSKGYYTIGNNQERVPMAAIIAVDTLVPDRVMKGYYSIEAHQQKLKKKSGFFWQASSAPVFTKGYYSIGDHANRMYRSK